jgi:Family of unknown function (DUF6335)
MAKRKAARPAKRVAVAARSGGSGRSSARPVKGAKKAAAGKPAQSAARVGGAPGARATAIRSRKSAGRAAKSSARTKPRPTTKPLGPPPKGNKGTLTKGTDIDRARFAVEETVPTPPSSLNMKRRGSAVRTGRAEIEENLREHQGMSPDITANDVDVNVEDAYFTGDEAPGGDNPTPDQDVVDDIGKALGLEYQDNEELKSGDKVSERDKHRWELDPASSEDYKDRK